VKIVGTDGLSKAQVQEEVQRGGKFVFYQYCVSVIVVTFKRSSSIYFLKAGESRLTKGLLFSAVSLLTGWWGIPWGPIYTVQTIAKNFSGGRDITRELMAPSAAGAAAPIPQAKT
jgi:hypothetical protein